METNKLRKVILEALLPVFEKYSNKTETGIKIENEDVDKEALSAIAELNSESQENEKIG